MEASIVSGLLLAVSGFGLLYLALATVMLLVMALRRRPVATTAPSITVLKPLHGDEPGLADTLATICQQDYAGPYDIVFGVQSRTDRAIEAVHEVQRRFPDRAIRLVVDATGHGGNRKVSNLINLEPFVTGEIVVLADSDIVVAPDYLTRIAAELEAPQIGAVTCLYHGLPRAGLWSRLAALSIDTHFLPGVAVGLGLGMAQPCFGSTIALRRETLERIGGFRSVADDLADDHALGAKVRALGLKVAIPSFSVGHVFAERSVLELARQELRWARTIRQIDPMGHAGSVLSHPLPFAVAGFLVEPGLFPAFMVLLAVACRTGLCLAVERGFGLKPHRYRLVALRDCLSFGIFAASFLGRRVDWRGHRYTVAPTGALSNAES